MYTIDLLKGRGRPVRNTTEDVAAIAVGIALPTLIVIIMIGTFITNSVSINIQKRVIANYEKTTSSLSEAVAMRKAFEDKKAVIKNCFTEVAGVIGKHTQWSPILVTISENLPDSMLMTKIDVREEIVKTQVPARDDPQKMVSIDTPVRTLYMSIRGTQQANFDAAVRGFRDRLRGSEAIGPKLKDIRIAQEVENKQGQNIISYEVFCEFKPGL